MRWFLMSLMLPVMAASAQTPASSLPATIETAHITLPATPSDDGLRDAPSEVLAQQDDVVALTRASRNANGQTETHCTALRAMRVVTIDVNQVDQPRKPCLELVYPYERFLTTNVAIPLSWQQKGYRAIHDITDPANLGTIVGISAITIGADSHTAYGPGLKGFGKIAGVSLLQDATGEFFGTFLVPSIMHQDPRYYRMKDGTIPRRFLYAVSRTFISRSDSGRTIPNYGTLSAYPITAELANLYVPGIQTNAESTGARIAIGLAIDPANNLIAEFLPDVAKHVHIRIIFVQSILNNIASDKTGTF